MSVRHSLLEVSVAGVSTGGGEGQRLMLGWSWTMAMDKRDGEGGNLAG